MPTFLLATDALGVDAELAVSALAMGLKSLASPISLLLLLLEAKGEVWISLATCRERLHEDLFLSSGIAAAVIYTQPILNRWSMFTRKISHLFAPYQHLATM